MARQGRGVEVSGALMVLAFVFGVACADDGGENAGGGTGGSAAGASTGGVDGVTSSVGGGDAGLPTGGTGSAGTGSGGNTSGSGGATGDTSPCPTSPGAAFTALSSYSASDGGYGPAEVSRHVTDASLGTDEVAIFRPAAGSYGKNGVRHPLLVWGNGMTNTVDIWQGFLSRVASYGFVVVAPEQTQVTSTHMNDALDYVLALAVDETSGDCGKIDATKIGATGYSLGGMGALGVAADERIAATFIFASRGNVSNLHGPWAVVAGDEDVTFTWDTISPLVTGSAQPAFGAALDGVGHNSVAGNGKAQQAYLAWLRWQFMGDPVAHDLFVGASCGFCGDSDFSSVVKSDGFDAL